MKTRHTSGKKIYFTVFIDEKTGLNDQMDQLRVLRKLGFHLGYDYLHTPLRETRHMDLMFWNSTWFTCLPKPIRRLYEKILTTYKEHIFKNPSHNIFYFLGLNQYFSARNQTVSQQLQTKKRATVNVKLSISYFEKERIYTFEELNRRIKEHVSAKNDSPNPCLLRLSMTGHRASIRHVSGPIKTLTPNPTNELDLSTIYFEHRRKHPWKSRFPRDGLKTLVHIRLGDVASVKTPWGTWIYYDRSGTEPRLWRECRDQSEFRQLTIADFHNFVRDLTSYFSDNAFAVLFSSDGFKRTFRTLNKVPHNKKAPEITPEKIKAMEKSRRHCEREFKLLENIKNSVAVIGETLPNLFNFIHSSLTADLIITAFPIQHQITNFLTVCFENSDRTSPIVILLHKPLGEEEELHRSLQELCSRGKHFIPVDITDPDFAQIARRLNELSAETIPVRLKNQTRRF